MADPTAPAPATLLTMISYRQQERAVLVKQIQGFANTPRLKPPSEEELAAVTQQHALALKRVEELDAEIATLNAQLSPK